MKAAFQRSASRRSIVIGFILFPNDRIINCYYLIINALTGNPPLIYIYCLDLFLDVIDNSIYDGIENAPLQRFVAVGGMILRVL